MLRAIESGYVQREIQRSAYEYQQAVERHEEIVVGVNQYAAQEQKDQPQPVRLLRIDESTERDQIERLRALRARRDSPRAARAIAEVERRARTEENLLPAIQAAVEAFATVGEISDAMRRVFGEYQEAVSL
jgi:methylmalonyl-CoA mutase N-terminal domain/subunit